ncbi:hypothetical protein GC163_23855 [bacterium]|nr:hypothetical protein [bacterium]
MSGNQVIPVDDLEESTREAKAAYESRWEFTSKGTPKAVKPAPEPIDGLPLHDLCNHFLSHRSNRMDSGEPSPFTFAEYQRTCQTIVSYFETS